LNKLRVLIGIFNISVINIAAYSITLISCFTGLGVVVVVVVVVDMVEVEVEVVAKVVVDEDSVVSNEVSDTAAMLVGVVSELCKVAGDSVSGASSTGAVVTAAFAGAAMLVISAKVASMDFCIFPALVFSKHTLVCTF